MISEKERLPEVPAAVPEGGVEMAWVPLYQTLPTHRKTRKLTRALGLKVPQDIPQVVGHLCIFWLWCIDNTPNGDLSAMDAFDVADAAGWTGDAESFFSAMLDSGFIDVAEEDSPIRVHDWEQYIGRYVDRMEQFRIKQEKGREKNRIKQQNRRERLRAAQNAGSDAKSQPDDHIDGVDDPDSPFGVDREWLKVAQCYGRNIGTLPIGTSLEMLVSYYEDLGAEVVCKAIEETNKESPSNPWQFLRSILNEWAEKGIDTPEKADAHTRDRRRQLDEAKRRKEGKKNGNEPPAITGKFY